MKGETEEAIGLPKFIWVRLNKAISRAHNSVCKFFCTLCSIHKQCNFVTNCQIGKNKNRKNSTSFMQLETHMMLSYNNNHLTASFPGQHG